MEKWKTLCDEMCCEELEEVIRYCKKLKEHTARHAVTVPLNTSDEDLEHIMDIHTRDFGGIVKITSRKQIGEMSVRVSFETRE